MLESAAVQLSEVLLRWRNGEVLDYDAIYCRSSRVAFACADRCARSAVAADDSGTGLTHLGSAKERQAMHLGRCNEGGRNA